MRAGRIAQAWADQKVVREIMGFLHSHGVGTARAVRIFKTYGNDAVQVMAENPYRLARDIRGIGFRTADAIAARLGIEPTATIHLLAGINDALLEASGEGHCGLPTAELIKLAGELLVITGGPGVGKTTLINAILRILAAKQLRILLCAPTGRAAKRRQRPPEWRPRPSTGCWSSIPRPMPSGATSSCRCRPPAGGG